ncbi:glycosyltransferase family 4 protein [uncultured Pseudoalteromonas sp.]|uniref:glycosyltransferase family 4 protein n=1 Tax=uncultured Pseudoalteromonas sp. TaxID=114053 RepID=UPI002598A6DE|nr:glycosyltransferase family 4 protein [uncultured Pseudoalteromonas sp.]|tara:strand:+ start:21481 stop:22536 length:1056 start_codon:yes stop_codon:yes gene_type:complete
MKVLHVAEALKGGVETYLKSLVLSLKDRDVESYLLVKEDVSWLEKSHVYYYDHGSRSILGLFKLARMYLHLVKKLNVDIVHLHGTFSGLVCRLAKVFTRRVPIIYCSHGWAYSMDKKNLTKKFYQVTEYLLSFLCHKVVCISHYDFSIKVTPPNKTVLIENAITDHFSDEYIKPESKKLLFVGRFDHQKGIDILLNAFKKVDVNYELIVVGGAVHGTTINKMEYPNVSFLGWLSGEELKQAYLMSSAVIIPSRWEGFGLVALEAMSASRTIFTSGVGGLKYLTEIIDGDIFNDESELISLLIQFNSYSDKKIQERGCNARNTFKNYYTIERLSSEFYSLYKNVCGKEKNAS